MIEATTIAAEGQINPLLPAVPDLIWGSVAFLIVALAVYKFAWPSFSAMLDERGEKIEKGLKAAELAKAEVANERQQLQAQIQDAHREANEIREKAQENAKSIVAKAEEDARREADKISAAAQQRIAADTEAAARTLRADVGSLATELAGRIVGESVTDNELANRVTDRFLDELEMTLKAQTPAGQEA